MVERFIASERDHEPGELEDELLAFAYTIENSMLSAGARPEKDYTILDLYRLAQPFVLEMFRGREEGLGYDFPRRPTPLTECQPGEQTRLGFPFRAALHRLRRNK